MKKDPKLEIMTELSKGRTLREAIRFLNTDIQGSNVNPSQLMKSGDYQQVLDILNTKKSRN